MNTKINSINNIDFKELSKDCKDEKDLSNLTKNGYYQRSVKSNNGELRINIETA